MSHDQMQALAQEIVSQSIRNPRLDALRRSRFSSWQKSRSRHPQYDAVANIDVIMRLTAMRLHNRLDFAMWLARFRRCWILPKQLELGHAARVVERVISFGAMAAAVQALESNQDPNAVGGGTPASRSACTRLGASDRHQTYSRRPESLIAPF
jgi:hypothetical protein